MDRSFSVSLFFYLFVVCCDKFDFNDGTMRYKCKRIFSILSTQMPCVARHCIRRERVEKKGRSGESEMKKSEVRLGRLGGRDGASPPGCGTVWSKGSSRVRLAKVINRVSRAESRPRDDAHARGTRARALCIVRA